MSLTDKEFVDYNEWLIEKFIENVKASNLSEVEISNHVENFCKDDPYFGERKEFILRKILDKKRVSFSS